MLLSTFCLWCGINYLYHKIYLIVGVGSGYSQEELTMMSSTGQLALSGTVGDLAVFIARIQFGLTMS